MFSPLSCSLADDLAGLNIGSPPRGAGEQDRAAAVEVMGVLPLLLAALSASTIEAPSSAALLQPAAWAGQGCCSPAAAGLRGGRLPSVFSGALALTQGLQEVSFWSWP